MTETQAHGFMWEKDLLQHVYGVTEEEMRNIGYTNKTDLPAGLNRLGPINVSIKTTGSKNAVCMGSCLRFYDTVSNPAEQIHMTVVQYKQTDTSKQLEQITEVDLTNSVDLLFGTITRIELEDLNTLVRSVPQKCSPTPEQYTKMYSLRNSLQQKSRAIHLDIKCNSQQSRLQCSFNHFQKFLQENPARIVATSNSCEFRGGKIASAIVSCRRKFHTKGSPV